jgi:hypothetical protein
MNTNLTEITNATDAELDAILGIQSTVDAVVAALQAEGLQTRIAWQAYGGELGRVSIVVGKTEVAFIRVQNGRASVPTEVQAQYGHGNARLPSHPLYPAPISNPLIERLIAACEAVNG